MNESSCPGSPQAGDGQSRGPTPGLKALGLHAEAAPPGHGVDLVPRHKLCGQPHQSVTNRDP